MNLLSYLLSHRDSNVSNTVFTGNQGGSVVQSLLRNSATFRVRGITRNPDSPKAKELAKAGVEVVGADGFKKDELVKAFKDSWAIFVNTNSDDSVRAARNPWTIQLRVR